MFLVSQCLIVSIAASVIAAPSQKALTIGETTQLPEPAIAAPLPSVEDIMNHMHNRSYLAGKSLFFTGFGLGWEILAEEYGQKHGLLTHEHFWVDRHLADQWEGNREFWLRTSTAMALLTSLDAFVLLPSNTSGTTWRKEGVWNTLEWPILIRNPNVTRVIRVNPDNDKQEVIHEKVAGAQSKLEVFP